MPRRRVHWLSDNHTLVIVDNAYVRILRDARIADRYCREATVYVGSLH